MFKIKTLIITLTVLPLIVLFNQLTSFAQVSSPDTKIVETATSTSESSKVQVGSPANSIVSFGSLVEPIKSSFIVIKPFCHFGKHVVCN